MEALLGTCVMRGRLAGLGGLLGAWIGAAWDGARTKVRGKMGQLVRDGRHGGFTRVGQRLLASAHIPGLVSMVILGCSDPLPLAMADPATALDARFSCADEADLDAIAACADDDPPTRAQRLGLFRHFLAAGHCCAVARADDRVIGYVWAFAEAYLLTVDDYGHTRLPVGLEVGAIFTGNGYVTPSARNHGIFRHLKRYLMRQYPPGTPFYTSVNALNDASLAANRALGFTPLALVRFAGPLAHTRLSVCDLGTGHWTHFGRCWPAFTIAATRLLVDTRPLHAVSSAPAPSVPPPGERPRQAA
jgi:GNAT superfamily N-acetyltransferase